VRHLAIPEGADVRVLLDHERLSANLVWFHRTVAAHGLTLRAHVKGHRLAQVTSRQMAAGASGIVAQTAREALHHVTVAGVADVVIARPTEEPWRFGVYASVARDLQTAGARTTVQVASRSAIAVLADEASRAGIELGVRLEVDVGAERGLAVSDVVAAARDVTGASRLRLEGVAGYYSPVDALAASRWAHGARAAAHRLVEAAHAIRDADLECAVVSVGGTLNGLHASGIPGVTEISAGAYALADASVASASGCAPALGIEGDVDDGVLERAAVDLLSGSWNEWDPSTTATTPELVPADPDSCWGSPSVRLVPAHICPVMMRVGHVDVTSAAGREPYTRWTPVLLPEVEP
jgi:D-serine deaminase-like pyridoxal phosphate-dependent protein